MGNYCDTCGTKDVLIRRIEIRCLSNFDRNHNYIIHNPDLCKKCYMELYREMMKVIKKF